MKYILVILRFLLIMISNFGYYNLLRKYVKIDTSFLPVITISLQVLILFLAGIMNILGIISVIMLGMGVLLFVFDFLRHRAREYLNFVELSYAYMGICMLFLSICLYGSVFSHFDDFSHWATMVQEMLSRNQYPNIENNMVSFLTYPPGTATYIYYFCLLAGIEESTMMLAQAYIMVCTLMPLFCCVNKHKIFSLVLMLVFTNFLFVYNNLVTTLLVDTVLPLFGMVSLLTTFFICCGRGNSSLKNSNVLWIIGPMLGMSILIKNSGIFFVLCSIVILAVFLKKYPEYKVAGFLAALQPFIIIFLWKRHYLYLFPNASYVKHTMSFKNYALQFSEKSSADIKKIAWNVFEYMLKRPVCVYIILIFILIATISLFMKKESQKKWICLSAAAAVMYLLYTAGMMGMYMFSMPIGEAFRLAGIERYAKSIDIAIFYMLMAFLLYELQDVNTKCKTNICYLLSAVIVLLLWGHFTNWRVVSKQEENTARTSISNMIEKNQIPVGSSCVVISSDEEQLEYYFHLTRYLLWSGYIDAVNDTTVTDMGYLNSFEYILLMSHDISAVNDWIEENYPTQLGNDVIITKFALSNIIK